MSAENSAAGDAIEMSPIDVLQLQSDMFASFQQQATAMLKDIAEVKEALLQANNKRKSEPKKGTAQEATSTPAGPKRSKTKAKESEADESPSILSADIIDAGMSGDDDDDQLSIVASENGFSDDDFSDPDDLDAYDAPIEGSNIIEEDDDDGLRDLLDSVHEKYGPDF